MGITAFALLLFILRLSNTSVGFIIDKDLSFEAHWDIYVRNCQNDLDFWGILVLISISPVYYNKNLFIKLYVLSDKSRGFLQLSRVIKFA